MWRWISAACPPGLRRWMGLEEAAIPPVATGGAAHASDASRQQAKRTAPQDAVAPSPTTGPVHEAADRPAGKRSKANRDGKQKQKAKAKPKQKKPNHDRARSNQLMARQVDAEFCKETTPYTDSKFRRIPPYFYTFNCYAKGRWHGRTILDVFTNEFQAETPEYYRHAITEGLITVNSERVPLDFIIDNNHIILNKVHRHEPPVTNDPLSIVGETPDLLAIDKPASIPVHPCGRYRHNTVQAILGHEHDRWRVYPCHRLDRLTSGLLIFCKNPAMAKQFEQWITQHQVEKQYICRVQGRVEQDEFECDAPLKICDQRLGLCCVHPEGKASLTRFRVIRRDKDTTVLHCFPKTGRMHQIRVHVQYLGHPIVNDPVYNSELWGPERGRGFQGDAARVAELSEAFANRIRSANSSAKQTDLGGEELADRVGGSTSDAPPAAEDSRQSRLQDSDCSEPRLNRQAEHLPEAAKYEFWPGCTECQIDRQDPAPEAMRIYLHAFRYRGPTFDFQTAMPWWSGEDWPQQLAKRQETY